MNTKGVGVCGCGVAFARKSPTQRYCAPCSEARDLERKKAWKRENPTTTEQNKAQRERTVSRIVANGLARSADAALTHTWMADPLPNLLWLVRFAVPFTYAASKNHIYTSTANGHVALRRESRAVRDLIEATTQRAVADLNVVQAKVYVDILVQKPNHKGDAVNVVDLVCDGIKRGLGVDDRWFSIRRLDWQIVKTEPQLVIGIGQADAEHQQACSHCGLIMPLAAFGMKRRNKMGVERACRECRAS